MRDLPKSFDQFKPFREKCLAQYRGFQTKEYVELTESDRMIINYYNRALIKYYKLRVAAEEIENGN